MSEVQVRETLEGKEPTAAEVDLAKRWKAQTFKSKEFAARLFAGEVAGVIWGLQRMRPPTPTAIAAIETLIGYLHHHRDRLNYRSRRRAGYPLGSGGIESAHKSLSENLKTRPK